MQKGITEFRIGEANYFATDEGGNKVHLVLDYSKNTFKIIPINDYFPDKLFRHQIETIALNLLGRKAKTNLVGNLKEKKII